MSRLVFLPDCSTEISTENEGLVRQSADTAHLSDLAQQLLIRQEPSASAVDAAYRGAMACALLLDSWQDVSVHVTIMTVDASATCFSQWVTAARPPEERNIPLRLVLLEKDAHRELLGMVDAQDGLTLVPQMGDVFAMLPERVTWVDRENRCFLNPLPMLSEADSDLLLRRLHQMNLTGMKFSSLKAALTQRLTDQREKMTRKDPQSLERLSVRAAAALSMMTFPGFSVRTEQSALNTDNALLKCFADKTVGANEMLAKQEILLLYGKPFARTSRVTGMDTNLPGESATLDRVAQELTLMEEKLPAWNRALADNVQEYLLSRTDNALLPAVREVLTALKEQAEQNSLHAETPVTLTYPWQEDSPAVQTLLHQALGAESSLMHHPFADRLTCMTACQLGDQTLRACSLLEDAVMLPPLSAELSQAAAETPSLLVPDAFSYHLEEDGSITSSFVLHGESEIRLERRYSQDEIVFLEHPPRIAVYPCVPMDDWHLYYVLVKGGDADVSALSHGEWQRIPSGEGWHVLSVPTYPSCLTVSKDGETLGAVPNLLEKEELPRKSAQAVASLDIGASSTAVTLLLGGQRVSSCHRPLLRMLLMNPDEPMDEIMMSLTRTSDDLPTAVMLTGRGDVPLTDGFAYQPESILQLSEADERQLVTSFKWRSDSTGTRARSLLLRHLMTDTALSALLQGASSLSWRVAMEDDMGEEGKRAMLEAVQAGAEAASEASGLQPNGKMVVSVAESIALGTYLRGEGGIRGGCAALDIGAGSIRAAVYLQSRIRPDRLTNIPFGAQGMLYELYAHHPERLAYDFGGCTSPELLTSAQHLYAAFSASSDTQAHLGKLCLMLDRLLHDHAEPLSIHLNARANAGQVTYLQSAAAEYIGGALFAAGLMTADVQADSMQNHFLPAQLPILLSGNGAKLLNLLPGGLAQSLPQLVSAAMGRTYAASSISIQPLPAGKHCISLGISAVHDAQDFPDTPGLSLKQSFSEQMLTLMQTLCMICPAHMWLLHPGLFDGIGRMTRAGLDTIRRVAAQQYGEEEELPSLVMKFLSVLRQTDVAEDQPVQPGN